MLRKGERGTLTCTVRYDQEPHEGHVFVAVDGRPEMTFSVPVEALQSVDPEAEYLLNAVAALEAA